MTSNDHSDPTFSVEPSQDSPPDDFIVEDLPDLEVQSDDTHDQLPSVDEYKASIAVQPKGPSSMKRNIIILVSLSCIILVISLIVKASKSSTTSQGQPGLSGRTQEVENFLFSNDVSTLPQLRDVGSAQHRAAAFVADGDALQMPLTTETARRFVERYVLALIYYQFNGPRWTYNLKFLTGHDHCDWHETFKNADGKTVKQGVFCNQDGYVIELNLAWNNLKGTHVPVEIGYLAELETFHVYYNEIGGSFPDSFRHMSNLKGIGMMKTGLGGSLPEWIGELTRLTTLGLGDNQLHGTIPGSIKNLRDLKILGLDGNGGLMGSIEKLKQLSNLEALYLESNALTGNLHNTNWPNLKELDVSNNALDLDFPVEFFNHPKLEVLDIHGNMMFGTFPDDIFENTQLEFFAAYNAGFSGTIPDRIGFLKNLKHLDLSFNGLNGTITDTLTKMTNLQYLATSGNHFTSQPMLDLSKLTNLVDLSMKHNHIVGSIPNWIGELTNLHLLDFDSNELTGSIPTWIGLVQSLEYLLLNRNQLTGTIPTQLQNMHHLQVLLLDGNSMTGNANVICESEKVKPSFFIADCYPGTNGERPEIECRCCTQCCADEDTTCNNKQWTSNVDPSWEYGYIRPRYTFSLANAPASYSKADLNVDGTNDDAGMMLP